MTLVHDYSSISQKSSAADNIYLSLFRGYMRKRPKKSQFVFQLHTQHVKRRHCRTAASKKLAWRVTVTHQMWSFAETRTIRNRTIPSDSALESLFTSQAMIVRDNARLLHLGTREKLAVSTLCYISLNWYRQLPWWHYTKLPLADATMSMVILNWCNNAQCTIAQEDKIIHVSHNAPIPKWSKIFLFYTHIASVESSAPTSKNLFALARRFMWTYTSNPLCTLKFVMT